MKKINPYMEPCPVDWDCPGHGMDCRVAKRRIVADIRAARKAERQGLPCAAVVDWRRALLGADGYSDTDYAIRAYCTERIQACSGAVALVM